MSFWEGKQVVVTGGNGLIGTPLVRKLESLGARVCNLDLPEWDICNLPAMTEAIVGDICIHLAAMSHVEETRKNGLNAWEVNIRGTWNVLEACLRNKVKAAVTASSNHVYGRQEAYPVLESAPLNQLDTYSATKICMDYITRAYDHNYGLNTATIRNTNCYGPGDPHSSHIVPGTILALLEGDLPVIQSNGLVRKGYLYVDDVADAYLLVAEHLYQHQYRGVYNVGAPSISSQELVQMIMDLMGKHHDDPVVLGKPTDQHDEQMDSSKIMALGWEPQYSLWEGLSKTIKWFRENAKVPV